MSAGAGAGSVGAKMGKKDKAAKGAKQAEGVAAKHAPQASKQGGGAKSQHM